MLARRRVRPPTSEAITEDGTEITVSLAVPPRALHVVSRHLDYLNQHSLSLAHHRSSDEQYLG